MTTAFLMTTAPPRRSLRRGRLYERLVLSVPFFSVTSLSVTLLSVALLSVSLLSVSLLSVSLLSAPCSAQEQRIRIRGISAPHPSHCMSAEQWRSPRASSPLSLFLSEEAWAPCPRAIAEEGYTIFFRLAEPVEIDELRLSPPPPPARRGGAASPAPSRRGAGPVVQPHPGQRLVRELEVLLFDNRISRRRPIHVEPLRVLDNFPWPRIRFEGPVSWNPRLLQESGFSRRREALSFPLEGAPPPLRIDRFGVVIRRADPGEGHALVGRLSFFRAGREIPFERLPRLRSALAKRLGDRVEAALRQGALVSDERWLIFAPSGVIWGLFGEEDEPRRAGQWRRVDDHIELSPVGRERFEALPIWVDELPTSLEIRHPLIGGTYRPIQLRSPPQLPLEGEVEQPPSFEELTAGEQQGGGGIF